MTKTNRADLNDLYNRLTKLAFRCRQDRSIFISVQYHGSTDGVEVSYSYPKQAEPIKSFTPVYLGGSHYSLSDASDKLLDIYTQLSRLHVETLRAKDSSNGQLL